MKPKAKQRGLLHKVSLLNHHNTLDNLGKVSEVECVVRARRGRQQIAATLGIEFDGGRYHWSHEA
eukprot:542118-Amorphochlora_amoeboformis.AAC.1